MTIDSPSKSLKHQANISRKLEMEFISTIDRRHNNSNINNKYDDDSVLSARRRRRSNNIDYSLTHAAAAAGSSSSDTDSHINHNISDDEIEIKALLGQSRSRLENTEALKIRQHLLRPEDYVSYNKNLFNSLICSEVELSLKIDHRCVMTMNHNQNNNDNGNVLPESSNVSSVTRHGRTITNFTYRSACKLSTILFVVASGFVAFWILYFYCL